MFVIILINRNLSKHDFISATKAIVTRYITYESYFEEYFGILRRRPFSSEILVHEGVYHN